MKNNNSVTIQIEDLIALAKGGYICKAFIVWAVLITTLCKQYPQFVQEKHIAERVKAIAECIQKEQSNW
jgi:hypothetical protein